MELLFLEEALKGRVAVRSDMKEWYRGWLNLPADSTLDLTRSPQREWHIPENPSANLQDILTERHRLNKQNNFIFYSHLKSFLTSEKRKIGDKIFRNPWPPDVEEQLGIWTADWWFCYTSAAASQFWLIGPKRIKGRPRCCSLPFNISPFPKYPCTPWRTLPKSCPPPPDKFIPGHYLCFRIQSLS